MRRRRQGVDAGSLLNSTIQFTGTVTGTMAPGASYLYIAPMTSTDPLGTMYNQPFCSPVVPNFQMASSIVVTPILPAAPFRSRMDRTPVSAGPLSRWGHTRRPARTRSFPEARPARRNAATSAPATPAGRRPSSRHPSRATWSFPSLAAGRPGLSAAPCGATKGPSRPRPPGALSSSASTRSPRPPRALPPRTERRPAFPCRPAIAMMTRY